MSPSSDIYVGKKLKDECIPFDHRVRMAKLACKEHNSQPNCIPVFVSTWEGLQPKFVSHYNVTQRFREKIHSLYPRINVFYIAGSDLFRRCPIYRWKRVVVIQRPGVEEKFSVENFQTDFHNRVYICNDPKYSEHYIEASSTQIRNKHQNGEPIDDITYQSVIDYLENELGWKK